MAINNKLFRFFTFTALSYVLWLLAYEFILKPSGYLDHILTENISYIICMQLDVLNLLPHYNIAGKTGETFIYIGNNTLPVIRVGASCNGLELIVLFIIFIAFYPSQNNFKKWAFIVVGAIIIHGLNIFRNTVLTLMVIAKSSYFDFFHRYVFIFFIYGAIFLLWLYWANKQKALKTNE